MYRERALLKFKRYYFHGIRDGKSSDDAATEAMWKARGELLEEVQADPKFADDIAREELWADCLILIFVLRSMLEKLPIDRAELLRRKVETDQERQNVSDALPTSMTQTVSASKEVADVVNHGIEVIANGKQNKEEGQ